MIKLFTLKNMLFTLALASGAISQASMAATDVETLEQRISELESILFETAGMTNDLDNRLKVSSYADIELVQSTKPDSDDTQLRLHHMALIFKKRINNKWRYNAEIEFEDAPFIEFEGDPATCDDCNGRIFVESLTVDYTASNHTTIRAGRFFTPVGIWSVNHYPPFVATQLQPGNTHEIYPHVIDGINIMGTLAAGKDTFINYDLFTGNGAKPSTNNGGLKLNLILPWFSRLETGTSFFIDHIPGGTGTTTLTAYNFHLKSTISQLTIQTEHSYAHYHQTPNGNYHKMGYYFQAQYYLGKHWSVGARHDHFENTNTSPGETKNNLTNSLFTNYRIDNDTVLKLEHHFINDSVNYQTTIASIAINLGN